MEVQQTIITGTPATKSVANLRNVAFILLRFLFIALLFILMVVAIKTGFTRPLDFLKDLLDGFNGVYGSYLVIITCGTGLSAAVGRHLKLWFRLQSLVEDYYLSPLSISSAAMFLVLKSSENVTLHHQILALSMFLGAHLFRFSGTQDNIRFRNRMLCRINEYVFYWSVLQFDQIWSFKFLLPAVIIVCICRSQEFFQIWREDSMELDQANEGMKRLDNILSSAGYINPGSSAFQVLFRIPHQHLFLWDQGSGMLMFLVLFIVGLSCIVVLKSSETIEWKVTFCGVYITLFIYLLLQILPGLFVRLDRAFEHIKQDDSLIKIMQVSWFYEIASFLPVLVAEGLPIEDGPAEDSECLWSSLWKMKTFEGIELIGYVIIFTIARALGRGCVVCMILLLRITRLGIKLESLWCRRKANLAYLIAYLSISDIMSTMRIIEDAEAVLGTKKLCIKIRKHDLADVLQKAMH